MRIAFVSEGDADDILHFSGTTHRMARALSDLGEVTRVQVPFYEDLTGELRTRLAEIGRVASRLVAQARPDVILCQGTSAIPGLVTDKPIAFWHDTTWFGMKRLSPRAFRAKYPVQAEWDETVLRKARLAIFASEWAAAGAREAYGVREDRFAVVPFGANLESDWSPAEAVCAVNRRGSIASCELAFIGVDWRRKGLPLACRTVELLRERGVDARLHVIGVDPDQLEDCSLPVGATLHGFLRRDDPEHVREFESVLSNCSFLLHPASFEPFGICLAEANAFGLPVISTPVNGIPSVVRSGRNGRLFPRETFAARASDFILEMLGSPAQYSALALASFDEYRDRLNWRTGVRIIGEHFVHF